MRRRSRKDNVQQHIKKCSNPVCVAARLSTVAEPEKDLVGTAPNITDGRPRTQTNEQCVDLSNATSNANDFHPVLHRYTHTGVSHLQADLASTNSTIPSTFSPGHPDNGHLLAGIASLISHSWKLDALVCELPEASAMIQSLNVLDCDNYKLFCPQCFKRVELEVLRQHSCELSPDTDYLGTTARYVPASPIIFCVIGSFLPCRLVGANCSAVLLLSNLLDKPDKLELLDRHIARTTDVVKVVHAVIQGSGRFLDVVDEIAAYLGICLHISSELAIACAFLHFRGIQ